MDRATARQISEAAEAALRDVAERFGVTVKARGGNFTTTTFTAKFEFAAEGAGEQDFERDCRMVGMVPDHFGAEFEVNGSIYKVSGLNLRAKKYPVIATKLSDGRSYKFPAETVKLRIGF